MAESSNHPNSSGISNDCEADCTPPSSYLKKCGLLFWQPVRHLGCGIVPNQYAEGLDNLPDQVCQGLTKCRTFLIFLAVRDDAETQTYSLKETVPSFFNQQFEYRMRDILKGMGLKIGKSRSRERCHVDANDDLDDLNALYDHDVGSIRRPNRKDKAFLVAVTLIFSFLENFYATHFIDNRDLFVRRFSPKLVKERGIYRHAKQYEIIGSRKFEGHDYPHSPTLSCIYQRYSA
ncbi:hypothetical protein F5Y16DRAFT_197715 [Xylariaceae sp. FL0255]|nr:hypothetical protein F5Y16DRAFT_197715 [Xylariaceae sp. FL0255]